MYHTWYASDASISNPSDINVEKGRLVELLDLNSFLPMSSHNPAESLSSFHAVRPMLMKSYANEDSQVIYVRNDIV